MSLRHTLVSLGVLAGVVFLVAISAVYAAPPANFQNETIISNLNQPTAIAFQPSGKMLIIQRGGIIHVVQPGASQVDPTPFLQITNINTTDGERGLVGIALDPNFSVNNYYYVFYTANSPLRNRVSRFTAAPDGNSTVAGSEFVVWEDPQTAKQWHHGGTVAFGPDGYLYISQGDGWDVPQDAQSLTNTRGKIHRVASDGTVPTDNPFYDGTGSNIDSIWARGLRNPFRFSFDSATGKMYIADVGGNNAASSIEEVNVGAAGANYGWPTCEGVCGTSGMTNPIFTDPHSGRDSSITGGFVYRGSQFPAIYTGVFFYGDYVQNYIRYLTFDGGGAVTGTVNFEPTSGAEDGPYGEIVDLKQGPEGALYYVDFGNTWEGQSNPGTIRRIRYTATNQPPTVMRDAAPLSGPTPLTVTFSSVGSFDPEGLPLSYLWDFGDGTPTSTEANPVHVYTQTGQYIAHLSISDGVNTTVAPTLSIQVGNAPTASILTPANNSLFQAGDVINITGSATDTEDGTLPASAYSWTVVFLHDSHQHPHLGPITGATATSFNIGTTGHDYSGNTGYQIMLTVTDSSGLQYSTSTIVRPRKVNLTFNTLPAPLQVRLDGVTVDTPYVKDTMIGFEHVVEAFNQGIYTFASWSQGGPQTNTIVAPATDTAYTATYTASNPLPPGLIGAYPFSEGTGTSASNLAGSGNTASLVNATWNTEGKFGNSVTLNGTNAYLDVVGSTVFATTTAPFTFEAWVYLNNFTGNSYPKIAMLRTNSTSPFEIGFSNQSSYLGVLIGSASTWSRSKTNTAASGLTGAWRHVAITYNGAAAGTRSNFKVYLDGAPQTLTNPGSFTSISQRTWFGSNGQSSEYWNGKLDEVRIYNRELTQAEIQSDMNTPLVSAPDTVPPVLSNLQPSGVLPSSTTATNLTLATNENATCRFATVAGTTYASMTSTFTTTGGTSHSTSVGGLVAGQSYTFYVRCADAAGNASTSDAIINFSVAAPDTIAPVAEMTAPLSGASLVGSVTLSADASDNIAIAGVQFLVDGSDVGLEDTSFPYSISWNSTGVGNGAHTVSARARDAAGNQTTSAPVSVTVANPTIPGLVAAFNFDQGSGLQLTDVSGNGNNGAIEGAVWTTGKTAGGLSFDGNDLVRVSDSASLDLASAVTLEAWVMVPVSPTGWRTILAKDYGEFVAYALYANSKSTNRTATVVYASGAERVRLGTTRLSASVWTHVATTYDGVRHRLYINGVQQTNQAQTGAIPASTGELLLGANTPYGEYFKGVLDDIRIFNVVRNASQIGTDMNTPVN